MSGWLDRTGYVTVIAFIGGAIIAVVVIVIVLVVRSGGGGDNGASPTSTKVATPATPTVSNVTPTVAATATPENTFEGPDDAVAAYVSGELNETYIGACPPVAPSGQQPPAGICSKELYVSAELATYNLGPYGGEALGEAVVVPDANGLWSLSFYPFPALDATISVGGIAMVFQAENCLNFHSAPNTTSEVLSCQIDGTSAQVVEGPTQADNETWWRLEGYGWAAQRYLAPVR